MKVEYQIDDSFVVTLDKQTKSVFMADFSTGGIQPVSLEMLSDLVVIWREVAEKNHNLNIESIDALAIDLKEIENEQDG